MNTNNEIKIDQKIPTLDAVVCNNSIKEIGNNDYSMYSTRGSNKHIQALKQHHEDIFTRVQPWSFQDRHSVIINPISIQKLSQHFCQQIIATTLTNITVVLIIVIAMMMKNH